MTNQAGEMFPLPALRLLYDTPISPSLTSRLHAIILIINCFVDYVNYKTSASSFFNSSNVNAGTQSAISSSDILPFLINFSAIFFASL